MGKEKREKHVDGVEKLDKIEGRGKEKKKGEGEKMYREVKEGEKGRSK